MIRSHFGLQKNPFDAESLALLAHQQEVFDILKVHARKRHAKHHGIKGGVVVVVGVGYGIYEAGS